MGTILITDHSWPSIERERAILEAAGHTAVDAPAPDEATLAGLAEDADAIMTCFAQVTRSVIERAPKLRVISRYGVGVDNIDVATASARGIPVTNVPDYCVDEVAEHALALLLACWRNIIRLDRAVQSGRWTLGAAGSMHRLAGRTLGIVGFGRIGQRLWEKVLGLGLKVLVYDPYVDADLVRGAGATPVDLDTLLRTADLVSLHSPLVPETRDLIGAEALAKMKPTAVLVNAARGGLVDEAALAEALRAGRIAAAGLDVLPSEPPGQDDPLIGLENVVLTPHAAFFSEESLAELQERAARNVVAILSGQLVEHVVNREALTLGAAVPGGAPAPAPR